ncbi:hypothetical protein [Burkholderia cenocepacia]|uniref:hypothetical protein n=1 Tax=Burkholderia cenocepacia TaxID=95486 RepID=UPI0021197040|nr:hypothetical protein [Burkholderia cenocepacia]
MEDAAYHLAASSQSVRHSVRRAIHRRHQLRSFNRPQHTKFLTRPENLLHIYADPGSGALLGASMLLTQGEHLAHLIAWAIQAKQTVNDLLAMPYYHPSIEEMLQSALKSASQQMRP